MIKNNDLLSDEEIEEILNKIFKHQTSKENDAEEDDEEDDEEKEDIDIYIDEFDDKFDDDEQRKIYSYLKSKFSDEDDMLDDMYKKVSDAVENKSKDSTNERIEALEACVALLLALQAIK